MGQIIIIVIVVLAMLNAVRTMRKQKQQMKNWECTGDCHTCQMPCQAKRIYGLQDHPDGTAGPKS